MKSENLRIREKKRSEQKRDSEYSSRKSKEQKLIKIFHEDLEEHYIRSLICRIEKLNCQLELNIRVENAGNVWNSLRKSEHLDKYDKIFEKLVRIRVLKWNEFSLHEYVSPAEKSFERRRALGVIKSYGIVYDGFCILGLFKEYLVSENLIQPFPDNEASVIITNRQIATIGDDGRYHLRIAVLGYPAVISVQGLFSAPAKPKDYHISKFIGEDIALLKGLEIKEEVEKSSANLLSPYILSAFLWINYGISLCTECSCLFSDSHTIEELFHSKLQVRLCSYHKEEINKIKSDGA